MIWDSMRPSARAVRCLLASTVRAVFLIPPQATVMQAWRSSVQTPVTLHLPASPATGSGSLQPPATTSTYPPLPGLEPSILNPSRAEAFAFKLFWLSFFGHRNIHKRCCHCVPCYHSSSPGSKVWVPPGKAVATS